MDTNQGSELRNELNNQTDNGANEKWTPGAKGNTTSGPMDHTYPQGASQQQAIRGDDALEAGQDPSRIGQQPVAAENGAGPEQGSGLGGAVTADLPGGSMQSQQTGGTGPQQGITDSHQRQMEQHSGAWGRLEQPVGGRDRHSGTDLLAHPGNQPGSSQAAHAMNPQNPAHPELQGGSLGSHHDVAPGTYQAPATARQGFYSNQQSAMRGGEGTGMATPHQQGNKQSNEQNDEQNDAQLSTERGGSQTGTAARDSGSHAVHQSNDSAGGLPRSPGNSGPRSDDPGWLPGQSVEAEKNPVRETNDVGGGLPKSPAGANQLAGDRKMDDDTGFSRK